MNTTDRVALPLRPTDCPHFNTCNASVCVVDPNWRTADHLIGEAVCHYLRASGKAGAAERFADDPVFALCLVRLPEVLERHPDIRRRVEQAARSGFRSDNLRKRGSTAGERPSDSPDVV